MLAEAGAANEVKLALPLTTAALELSEVFWGQMMKIKLLTIISGAVLAAGVVNAEPVQLSAAEMDSVTAGFVYKFSGTFSYGGFVAYNSVTTTAGAAVSVAAAKHTAYMNVNNSIFYQF